jgi:uncharacterized protein YdeI (YjbR/CyaY-like superfamily)
MERRSDPEFFATPADWRRWLSKHHSHTDELWVGFYKRASGKPSITWPEAVDEALCFGWIDGIRKRLDDESYVIRFTPRRARSTWSAVNLRRVAELTTRGRMRIAGLRAHQARLEHKTGIYSFEQRTNVRLPPDFERELKGNAAAWRFFSAQARWYQRTVTWWIVSAKRDETRRKRLATLIADSSRARRVGPLDRVENNTTQSRKTERRQKRNRG